MERLQGVEWGEYRLGDLFDIDTTSSFDANSLTVGDEYDYVTRTSQNQGILRGTGFVNTNNINPAGSWSLGLLQMDFFYRRRPWYAGQFVRKVTPKVKIEGNAILFFQTILNMQKQRLLQVLVRNVDETFRNLVVKLPRNIRDGSIDFEFIDSFIAELQAQRIAELQAQRIAELQAYLTVTGLTDYTLTAEERKAVEEYDSVKFGDFDITEIFIPKNTGNILSEWIVENSGTTPYLCASSENNSVSSYIKYNEQYLDKGNCIFIGGKTFEVSYQEKDFYSNDSHNLTLRLKEEKWRDKLTQLYLATCVRRSLKHKYSWGDSVSNAKIKKDVIALPTRGNTVDYANMSLLISAIQKMVIKDVVQYADKKIHLAESVVSGR